MSKIVKNAVIIILFLTLCMSTALFAYLYFFAPEREDLSGEWRAELDMTKQAAATALGWLQDIEAVSVSLEDLESCMQDLTVQVSLNLERTGSLEGTFQCSVLPESYDACSEAAYEAFAGAFHALLAERLRMAGYEGGTDRDTLEALVTESFGMSTVSYLRQCVPDLLPSLEELQARYDGRGTYQTQDGVLIRQYDGGVPAAAAAERYMQKDDALILSEEIGPAGPGPFHEFYPVIYILKNP